MFNADEEDDEKNDDNEKLPSCANLISSPSKQFITNIVVTRTISFFV